MDRFGFLRTAAAVPVTSPANPAANKKNICNLIDRAVQQQAALVVFPELCVTGRDCGDLFFQQTLLSGAEKAVAEIAAYTVGTETAVVLGAPVRLAGKVCSCAIFINDGSILGIVPKDCGELAAQQPAHSNGSCSETEYADQLVRVGRDLLFSIDGALVGAELGEEKYSPAPKAATLACRGAEIIAGLCAEKETAGAGKRRRSLLKHISKSCECAYICSNAGFGESTTSAAYQAEASIFEQGEALVSGPEEGIRTDGLLSVADIDLQKIRHHRSTNASFPVISPSERIKAALVPGTDFVTSLLRPVSARPFIPAGDEADSWYASALDVQAIALASRLKAICSRKAVIGVSGGLDSTLALICTVRAFDRMGWDRKGIIAVTMPGFGTSGRTKGNADILMEVLGVTSRTIDITDVCRRHLADIGHDTLTQDTAYENAQARERTQILLDIANMENAIVVGTGDLSELALGWCTFGGDQISNYSVNASIPKTLVREMVRYAARQHGEESTLGRTLLDIVETPVSPELKGDGTDIQQRTEDAIGPYELHDFFIWNTMVEGFPPEKTVFLATKAFEGTFDSATVSKWAELFVRRFFNSQFKRSCSPDGPQVTAISPDPRTGWRMPSDAGAALWMEEI